MSTRLHAIGFAAAWTPVTADFLQSLANRQTRRIETRHGGYRLWRSIGGAELWFHDPVEDGGPAARSARRGERVRSEAAAGRITAVTPFHRGVSRCRIRVGRVLLLDNSNPLEGSCLAWLPAGGGSGREQPIVLELAPYALQPLRKTPYETFAQIVCFAHAVWAHASERDYLDDTPRHRRIRTGSFCPITETDVAEVKLTYRHSPITLGLVTGVVKRAIRHENPATGQPYYWLLLETRRGAFDVVANPDQIEGDISVGHVAQVCGSFLARLEAQAL